MSFGGQTPTIIVLKEGTDTSQGKGQIISNINACLAVQATIKSTLGPYGGDLLMVDANGKQTITNDGATVMKLLDIVHPAARILVDIARSQDAEVRVEQVAEYQAIVDAEWQIIFKKLEAVHQTGAKVVLSKLPIGDLATQYFADRDIFCAGRVASEDMERVVQATGSTVQSTCSDIRPEHLGTCGTFEERQMGGERFNFFEDCPEAKTCTLVLRGGAEQFIAEVERSLHDAIMIVKRAIRNRTIVAGGGAVEMEVSAHLHQFADLKNQAHKQQAVIKSFAKALEVIPRQLCDNAGFDATDILNKLRVEHRKGHTWAGVDFTNEGVADLMERFVWEPALVKINAIQAATEACCLILGVDETIRNEESAAPQAPGQGLPPGAAQRALRGRGRGMPRR
ncbi:hypothetical protein RB600_004767 [Gaeumannomyces tritici]